MNANLFAHFWQRSLHDGGRSLLETDAGRQWTNGDIAELSARFAQALIGAGARRGDRVAVQVEKSAEALALYLACLRAGIVYLPLNTAYTPAEIGYFLADAAPAVFVCRAGEEPGLAEVVATSGVPACLTLGADGTGSLIAAAACAAGDHEVVESADDDLAVIIYTSGTTGRSKGAMLTHGNLLSNGETLVDAWGFTPADVLLHALPLFHVHGLFVANHCVLLAGARMLFHARFDAVRVANDLPRASVLMGVPTFYTRLLAEPAFTRDRAASVRLFVSGSAPLLLETFTEFEARTGQRILERYGMSEAGMIASNPLASERKGGTVGLPLPGVEVRVADGDDQPLPAGEVGGIQIRGPNVFAGYWNQPARTAEEFATDRWFRTGDVGRFDADGYLSIVGRAKDLIITGGYNVYPKEIELVLDAIPGVLESAVIGLPHPDFGEAVTAVVVARTGVVVDEVALLSHVRTVLANYKVPKRIHVVTDLPRNAMGKVQKARLREQFTPPGA